ncbi:MAG TPA: isoprenylcysteine carboxylmethyltransferase family protein [Dokdonella sp.]|nr:isoprenylcysteine carboxylmethyltransferase family protein [Dokdonella sp.]
MAWAIALHAPGFALQIPGRILLATLFVLTGFGMDLTGLLVFRKAKTTLNPLAPDRSTSIVQTGPYALTRNPMYLGMALVLTGLCTYLANPISLLAVALFVAYITRFQIIPEERLLFAKFGDPYGEYKRSVRRWL